MLLIVAMVEEMAIPQADRRRLLKQMEMAENYQKSRYTGHCIANSNCTSHCTTFALSDPNCAEHYSNCSQEHMSICLLQHKVAIKKIRLPFINNEEATLFYARSLRENLYFITT